MSQKTYKVKAINKDGEGTATTKHLVVELEPIGGVSGADTETISQANGSSNIFLTRTNDSGVAAFTPGLGDTVIVSIEAP